MDKKVILIFGVGELQKSIIKRAQKKGLFVVGIDPCEDAYCKGDVDAFEVVGGQDYEGTLAVCKKYHVSAIVTAATDKPLVMMARVADAMHFPFYSVDTAIWSTDKFQMKQRFIEGGVPCAKGRLITRVEEADDMAYPVIAKPRDNSGSRGVKICNDRDELKEAIEEALQYSHLDSILVEEIIGGPEYSIESLHYDGKSEVIQFTEKRTTPLPYNVELGHKQPARLSETQKEQIREIVTRIGVAMRFDNCPSHTELKINDRGIFVIETSPRLGGDYITSTLTPLSTGINIEDQLLNIALGEPVDTQTGRVERTSGVCFFYLKEGRVAHIDPRMSEVPSWPHITDVAFKFGEGTEINKITSSLNRYGQFIVEAETREELDLLIEKYEQTIKEYIEIK